MVTSTIEGWTKKCEKYWPESGICKSHGPLNLSLVEEHIFSDYNIRTVQIKVNNPPTFKIELLYLAEVKQVANWQQVVSLFTSTGVCTLLPQMCITFCLMTNMHYMQHTAEGGSSRKVVQYHFTSWPDHGVPEYAGPILNYLRRIKAQHKPNLGPILVHCR